MLHITPNAAYSKYVKRWARVDDIVNGEARLKEIDLETLGESTYIRYLNPSDMSAANKAENRGYINGAVLFAATERTLSGLMGMMYRKQPKLPEFDGTLLEGLTVDVDGCGMTMGQQSQSVSAAICRNGRYGLLTDMPTAIADKTYTRLDVKNGHRPVIKEYSASSIIDWLDDGTLLVLCEQFEEFTDDSRIQREVRNRYLVYRLGIDGVTLQVFTDGNDGLAEGAETPITGANNLKLTRIPFSFVGSKNNKSSIDPIPLEPVSNPNLGHYKESANRAESSHKVAAIQPFASDDAFQQAAQSPDGITEIETGVGRMMVFGTGGSMGFASPPQNTTSRAMQEDYESQMVSSGAQIITPSGQAETAEAVKIKRASEASDLTIICANVSSAYIERIKDACLMVGMEYKDEYALVMNDEFFDSSMSADEALKQVQIWQGNAISTDVLHSNLKRGKFIYSDVDLVKMKEDINNESGAPLEFGD